MKLYQHVLLLIYVLGLSAAAGCGKTPLLSDISKNKLIVVIKGTYESNDPQPWVKPSPDDPLVQDDSVINALQANADTYPTVFLLDIAEIQLLDTNGDRHKFSDIRQTFALSLDDNDPYFNGIGQLVQNDDVPTRYYMAVFIQVRKMLFDNAKKFITTAVSTPPTAAYPASSAWSPIPFWDVFSEQPVLAFNFNKYQTHAYYDTLRQESYLINRVFPIVIGIGVPGMVFSEKFPVTVLEIRFAIKNFIKKYEVSNSDNDTFGYVHYYAPSDWLQDVQADETAIGGNLLTVARWYIPGLTGSIRGTNNRAGGRHVIAIPSGTSINNYTIPAPGNRRANNKCNIPMPPGSYLGTDISAQLNNLLKLEKWKWDWNDKFPALAPPPCDTTSTFETAWNTFNSEVADFSIPPLAVYAPAGGTYSIENVPAGPYDVYISPPATYGSLYTDGQFESYAGNPVIVNVGGATSGINFF
jgi:hypothetical protein